jgi:hypothetical protein
VLVFLLRKTPGSNLDGGGMRKDPDFNLAVVISRILILKLDPELAG